MTDSSKSPNKQSHFSEKGWDIMRNVLSPTEISEIFIMISKYIYEHKDKFEIWDINYTPDGKPNSIHCLDKFDSSFLDFFNKKTNLIDRVKEMLNSEVEIMAIEAFLKPAGTGMYVPIHQDNNLWCLKHGNALTAWIALDKINDKNGGLKLYENSHKIGDLNHIDSWALGTSQTIDPHEYKKFGGLDNYILNDLNPGDIQFHHSMTVHGSEKNDSQYHRRVITIQFKSVDDFRMDDKMKLYREKVRLQQEKLKDSIKN